MSANVYVAPHVADVDALHPYVRDATFRSLPIRDQLAEQARVIEQAHARGDQRIRMHVTSWWPGARGLSLDGVLNTTFTLYDAQTTIALEYGFQDWQTVVSLGTTTLYLEFEQALDDMLDGNLDLLSQRLGDVPGLVEQHSRYGHRATLLHYLGANGVESHRQRTPLNAPDLARMLILAGARRDAKANMYGGGQTPLNLSSTSAHPRQAGVAEDLNQALSE